MVLDYLQKIGSHLIVKDCNAHTALVVKRTQDKRNRNKDQHVFHTEVRSGRGPRGFVLNTTALGLAAVVTISATLPKLWQP